MRAAPSFETLSSGMWRSFAARAAQLLFARLALHLGLVLLAPVAVLSVGRTAAAQQIQMHGGLSSQLRMVQFLVIRGQIVARSEPAYAGQSRSASVGGAQRQERLTINLSTGFPDVHYQLTTADVELAIDVVAQSDGDPTAAPTEVSIRKQPRSAAGGVGVMFGQSADGELVLTIEQRGERITKRSKNLWQLLLVEPDLARSHLVPLLELLDGTWRLTETVQALEEALCRAAAATADANTQQWDALVAALASPRYAERQAADRALRAQGRQLVPYLLALDQARLDTEQRRRIKGILLAFDGSGEADTPDRVAYLLVRDLRVWLALLRHADLSTRMCAHSQLERMLGRRVEFDPRANNEVRAAQLEVLCKQLEDQGL